MDAVTQVAHYHDQTKHHPHRYARSLGYLDWATQPNPFRRFAGAPLIRLAPVTPDESSSYDDMYEPGRISSAAVCAVSISQFFECSLGISAWKQAGPSRWALRCNPSSGNLHPTEGYVVLGAVDGIHDRPGVYHYAPREHALEQRAEFATDIWAELMAPFPPRAFLVGLSSVVWREAWKYGERAFRYCQHDVGHAWGALRFAAARLGWHVTHLDALADADVDRLLGLDRRVDFANAEAEHPDLVGVVVPNADASTWPGDLDMKCIHRIAAAAWSGRANRLSPDHVDWEIIDDVADATRKKRASAGSVESTQHALRDSSEIGDPAGILESPSNPFAHRILRQRRSAVAFDGVTRIGAATLYRILSRVVPTSQPRRVPWDSIAWPAAVDLFLFVHRVDGLPAGLYALVRDNGRLPRLRAATRTHFAWTQPADCPNALPLYMLAQLDCREQAAFLSLGQDIAGDGVFSLGMIADFEHTLHRDGAWAYRRLFWEAGLIGQVLYLEAEAAGIRATGIGAYFDDQVHATFGLHGHAFQSLYHFTMGGPVHDPRLTTLPAYPWSSDTNP